MQAGSMVNGKVWRVSCDVVAAAIARGMPRYVFVRTYFMTTDFWLCSKRHFYAWQPIPKRCCTQCRAGLTP